MTNTLNDHSCHSLLTVNDKLFVIGFSCEVYDNVCSKFVAVNIPISFSLNKAISIGNKIVITGNNTSIMICYDVDKDERSVEPCKITKDILYFTCVKLPFN